MRDRLHIIIATTKYNHFLSPLISVSTPLIWVKTVEENRMMLESEDCLMPGLLKRIFTWDATGFLCEAKTDNKVECKSPLQAINWFIRPPDMENPEAMGEGLLSGVAEQSTALFLFDTAVRVQPTGPNAQYCDPAIPRALKKAWRALAYYRKPIIIVGHTSDIPPELEHYTVFAEHALPDERRLAGIAKKACSYFMAGSDDRDRAHKMDDSERDRVVGQLQGMTASEADNVLARAAQENILRRKADPEIAQGFDLDIIHNERVQKIRKSSTLEIIHPKGGLEMVGGLPELKSYFQGRRRIFDPAWRSEGLSNPKGVLLAGLSGTGKTLLSACIGKEWDATVVRGDVGACKGGLVGESERNFRKMLSDVEGLAGENSRVVFQLDEAGKMFGGGLRGGALDSGVSSGLSATFLTWRQNCTKPVYVIMTCNEDLVNFPPEWLRPGRTDRVFFVDVPDASGRAEVVKIHLEYRGWPTDDIDLKKIADATDGWTPAELEVLVEDSIALKLDKDGPRPALVETRHLIETAKSRIPMTVSNAAEVAALRELATRRGYPGVRGAASKKKAAKPDAEMGRLMATTAGAEL